MSGKDKNEEYFSLAPPKRSGWESFRIFLWNGETREFLGRTAASWGKTYFIFIFLLIFSLLICMAFAWHLHTFFLSADAQVSFEFIAPFSNSKAVVVEFDSIL